MTDPNIQTVVVSYNRRRLLERCVAALGGQTRAPDRILIVDNASTDGSADWITDVAMPDNPALELIRMPQNLGGAGGFAEGLRIAVENGADWIWMMDDDAEPHPNALEELSNVPLDPSNVYGSLAVNGDDTAWATTLLEPEKRVIDKVADIPPQAHVQSLPFLGFLIHRTLVEKIGLPDVGFFIAADDIEYCMRAEHAGARIVIVGTSHIEHPRSDRYTARLPGRGLVCLKLPPWKRYYDTRNRLLIARKYLGWRLLTQTIPGSFVRLFAALAHEPRKPAQLWAFLAGFVDGLIGIKGCRHAKWRIPR